LPIQTVKAKVASSVAAMMPMPRPPTSMTCVIGQLQPEQDDGDAQQPAHAESHARLGDRRRADDILEGDADQNREDHRAERRHPRQPSKSIRRCRHGRRQKHARQNSQRRLAQSMRGPGWQGFDRIAVTRNNEAGG
jgi:hypothetical protein